MTGPVQVEPVWLDLPDLLAIHERQLARHGGGAGIRDRGLLESAAARPRNSWAYGESDLVSLAASLAFGVARNHAFIDGNKRTAWLAARLFLELNGLGFEREPDDAIATVLALAAGDLSEDELADWFRRRIVAA